MVHVRKSTHLSTTSTQYMLICIANLVSIKEKGDCTAIFRFMNDKSEQKYIFLFQVLYHNASFIVTNAFKEKLPTLWSDPVFRSL